MPIKVTTTVTREVTCDQCSKPIDETADPATPIWGKFDQPGSQLPREADVVRLHEDFMICREPGAFWIHRWELRDLQKPQPQGTKIYCTYRCLLASIGGVPMENAGK